jgi:LuxR family transcriptional regulator, quorum-sensing system regulator BjaR1
MSEQHAFEVLEDLRRAKAIPEVQSIFSSAIKFYGAFAFVICDVPPGAPPGVSDRFASNWSVEWEERYVKMNYGRNDPIPKYVNRTANPYYWREAAAAFGADGVAGQVMEDAGSGFGMRAGLCVPIHGLTGTAGLISIASEFSTWRLSEPDDAALHMLSIYAYEAVRRLKPTPRRGGDPKILSRREFECVKWASDGKTSWETSRILNISEETVRHHLKNAARKLDTRTKAHLVGRAYRLNIL